jgi:hypothetical protein
VPLAGGAAKGAGVAAAEAAAEAAVAGETSATTESLGGRYFGMKCALSRVQERAKE